MDDIDVLIETRKFVSKIVNSMSDEDLLLIPDNFNNNIIWNVGHLVVTQQLLNYKLSGLPLLLDEDVAEMYCKGSNPKKWSAKPDIQQIKSWITELPQKLKEDYSQGLFKNYNSYTTSVGVTLNTIEDAIRFNNFHEGIHFGYILAMRRNIK
jgi:hypothetical protein